MKGPADRTKVIVRHLPPTIPEAAFTEQIDGRFGGRYYWLSFRPGKPSQKHQTYARAYIEFTKPEDVVEFAEFFNGHVFVNEKGTQCKAIVEFAPCQRVPKKWSKKDGREGTIVKDPDYLEFLEAVSKPVENLPSAEVQMDRREAERAGAAKDVPIITPLMDFVRQKRASRSGSRRIMSSAKPIRKVASGFGSPGPASSRRGSEKRRVATTMYVARDSAKSASDKEKSTYSPVPKRDDQSDKSVLLPSASAVEASEGRSGTPGTFDTGKKILLLKGKEKEISLVSGGMPLQQSEISKGNASNTFRQNQRREGSGRIVKSILVNKDTRQSRPSSAFHSEQQFEASSYERDRRPPRSQNFKPFVKDTNGVREEKYFKNDMHGYPRDKQDKRVHNKDRPDRGVWTPLRRSDGSHASDESLTSFNSHEPQKHGGRKGMSHDGKESDGSYNMTEVKPSKRGGPNFGVSEKQVWVQKSSAGS